MTRVIITFDLHETDRATDIELCLEWLASVSVRATFLVPTGIIATPRYKAALRALGSSSHELGTHGHEHDSKEMVALRSGARDDMGFLERSTKVFQEFFGRPPLCFRSPCWCGLGPHALDELERLGYQVDSSATPQRPGLLSSSPWDNPYLFAKRSPSFVRPTLLEVPTSCILVPLGAPTFQTLRRNGSLLLTRALLLEAAIARTRVVVAQLHVGDVVGNARVPDAWNVGWRDMLPSSHGGIRARKFIRMRDRGRIAEVSQRVVEELKAFSPTSFAEVYRGAIGRQQREAAGGAVT